MTLLASHNLCKGIAVVDFYISAIKFNADQTFIEQVKVRRNSGSQIGPELLADRAFIADLITVGDIKFKTVIRGEKGWVPGADVFVARGLYLVTDAHAPARLNLHNLPRFQ
ncbi:hypothetical protein [Pseudomonas putida]|jgi:hypothetical protein|uniref:hypothetical protein n=1 Tax=Pseudomonas putida TaxID=303 RepID=UPI002DBDD745|nr:hypothetical protein [Pseudomonas putida]WRW04768.1 hypothetical protein VPZ82_04925 [Pseudomonas putida]